MVKPGIYREYVCDRPVADAKRQLEECDDVYPDPVAFLKDWKRGYDEDVGTVHCYGYPGGFELYLVSLDHVDEHLQIPLPFGAWKGVDKWGKIDSFLLAADLGNICDIRDEMRLVVNDALKSRVLVYRQKDRVSRQNQSRWEEGLLLDNEPAYISQPRYPFESVNLLKAHNNQWSLVGFSPAQFYDALKEVGFRFPD